MSDVLTVRDLHVEFATDDNRLIKAVNGISFELKRGQTLGIVGESGSGKSVTSLAMMGLIPTPGKVTGGQIKFWAADGQAVDLLQLSPAQMQKYRGDRLAMVFQEPMSALNPVFTIGFQLTEAIRLHQNVSQAEARRQATARLQEVKLLPSDEELQQKYFATVKQPNASSREIQTWVNQQKLAILDRYPHELSGGQLQRVTIAMAISCNPAILIADEPTTALDVTVQATIMDLLRELRDRRQMSMMFITHDLGLVAEIADAIAVMYKGKIVEYGAVEQIFSQPQHPYTKGLLACRPALDSRPQKLLTVADFMTVRETPTGELEIESKQPHYPALIPSEATHQRVEQLQQQPPLLEVKNLQVGFPIRGGFGRAKRYFMAVNNVEFQVYPGETLGLVGESGCGKTTLGRTILRLIQPMGGKIFFAGKDVTTLKGEQLQRLRREMQIVFQNPYSSLDPRMKIGDAVMEPMWIHGTSKTTRQRRERAAEFLAKVGIEPKLMNRYPHEFSGGQRQRICIARALALYPEVKFIICDESVSSLDVSVQAQVLNLLKELQQELKLTYIFISHDLSVVKFMSDRILVMNQGQLVEQGSAETIYSQPQQEYTRKLIASIPTGSPERIHQRQQHISAIREQ
ncbi:MAG: Glutathione import ATP-binding protein GsiA [Chroococcidiopsis cubana SAG 39.79]|uniref:ABC transporter ATP-binding protein n=1 Tax=Chroococcidiopsis cubana SAG 39.79 TaxID=388085 RepID=A0AB37UKK2_9CYAN|nr:ABC transporter ATP-binding protein [Chroococcidiopsis cubana]MDZ4871329.1 Glutathione import ATP-binding protein GsiA [Chroococcidiopsis cubana SAG 39.79]PSB63127.1 ABC transporter ATP-binding protein [Chroococcidiopsis cubana CCALA 043]RUT11911.1 ABC transporter ATP-binding protein [Chroococcidiopsis cubana SAG 39.79]